jgi:alkylation response protein AidB-like acyl-CoA dehydrogenase
MIATDTERDTRLIEAAREMAPLIAARGDELEQGRRLPDDLVRDLIDARFFRMWQPRPYGGDEVDPLTVLAVTEELSRADGSVGWCLRTGVVAGFLNCRLDPEGAADIYGPDPSIVIAGCLHPPGEAVANDGGYRVSGRWPFASGCTRSAWMSGICRVIENGEPRLA